MIIRVLFWLAVGAVPSMLLGPIEGPVISLLIMIGFLIVEVEKQHRRIKELEGDDRN